MKKTYILFVLSLHSLVFSQSNTAVESGSIGQCRVWGHPYSLINTAAGTMNINTGVAVTVDQNRNIGAINLSGTGALDFSGANGITMSGSGPEIACRWDINKNEPHTLVNNDNQDVYTHFQDWGGFFTAPYSGNYRWQRGSGWSASFPASSSLYDGSLSLVLRNDYFNAANRRNIFLRSENNSCSHGLTPIAASWKDLYAFSLSAGETLGYGAQTTYSNTSACNATQMNAVGGNAVVYYDN